MLDVLVVGAGPAGLSAALVLGRCRRHVLVCDRGGQRNRWSRRQNGFLTRDGIDPAEFRQIAREQMAAYDTVEIRDVEVVEVQQHEPGYAAALADGTRVVARKLLLATGVLDELPPIPGFNAFYGKSAHHCPYCDGWEWRDQPLAIYGRGEQGKSMALELTGWSRNLVLCTDGPAELSVHDRARLARQGIGLWEQRIAALEGKQGMLEGIRFETGEFLARRALFFNCGSHQGSDLAHGLGCPVTRKGSVETSSYERTAIPGLYVAGDASRHVQLSVVAAAEGAMAAFAINTELLKETLHSE
ncbi:MAG: NAD(P)/FAD-dependent oxidoreductase [Alphaproteobacteria bacterium]|nr:NAD(P)/FAD-dependent oxidoreductase [Alphaproteobacteria bacterium]